MQNLFRNLISSTVIGAVLSVPGAISAQEPYVDPCYTMDANPDWVNGFEKMNDLYVEKDFEGALNVAQDLLNICSRSPILNYSVGAIYREMGNVPKAAEYFGYATDHTQEFRVADDMVKRMWFSYYEMENAEKICKREELEAEKARAEKAELKVKTLEEKGVEYVEIQNNRADILMWTGTGVGSVGLLMTIIGGALYGAVRSEERPITDIQCREGDGRNCSFKIKSKVTAPTVVLGIGVGMTVVGAVMAGIGGWYYSHPVSDDTTISLGVSPNSLLFDVTF